MKIALISPQKNIWAKNKKIATMFKEKKQFLKPWYSPNLSLLTIASVTPDKHEITLIDEEFEQIKFTKNFDIVGISILTQQALRGYEIADKFRNTGSTVVIGGIHATVCPEETRQHADSVIIGEGEELWNQFLVDFENKQIKNIYKNPIDFKTKIHQLPNPRYNLIKKNQISKGDHFFNMIPVQVTRGCPHDCEFCVVSKISGTKIRKKTIPQILSEINEIKRLFGNHLIVFVDDNLFVDKKFAEKLLNAMIPLKIKWFAQSDVSIAKHEDLIKLAYNAGCMTLLIGFESLNPTSLLNVNKSNWKMKQISHYNNVVNVIQENGIMVYAAFIIGFDHDDLSTFKMIKDFMLRNLCSGQFTILTPLPGSKLYKKLLNQKRIPLEPFWDKCSFFDPIYKPNKLSINNLENGLIELYNEVFSIKAVSDRYHYYKSIYKKLPDRWS